MTESVDAFEDECVYSLEAESVINHFYNADSIVYVEGKDDIPFWELMFKKFSMLDVEIQDVGSCTALRPYMEKISNGTLNAIVACDNDLSCFEADRIEHQNIIRTYGYSIENTLINSHNLLRVIKVIARIPTQKLPKNETDKWLEEFHAMTQNLVRMEVYNKINNLGVSITGDNSTRFMTSKTSCVLCPTKIIKYEQETTKNLHEFTPQHIDELLVLKGQTTRRLTNGHFLFSGAARFLTATAKNNDLKASLSYDSIYSTLILSLENTFSQNLNTHEYTHYERALASIVI